MTSDRKLVDPQCLPEILGQRGLLILQRYARRVRHSVDRIEVRRDGRSIDKAGLSHCLNHRLARSGQSIGIGAEDRFGERDQHTGVRHAAVVPGLAQNNAQIDDLLMILAARTEQLRMAGRSIEALVER